MSLSPTRIAVVALAAALVSACSRAPGSDSTEARPDSTASTAAQADSAAASLELRSTRWNLVAIGDKAVTPSDSARAAHIMLASDSKQVTGSGGCNRMFGVYELNGDSLRFSGVGSTKMACKDGMDTESAFLGSLLKVATYRITGRQLELIDSSGTVLARLEAASAS